MSAQYKLLISGNLWRRGCPLRFVEFPGLHEGDSGLSPHLSPHRMPRWIVLFSVHPKQLHRKMHESREQENDGRTLQGKADISDARSASQEAATPSLSSSPLRSTKSDA